jgi:hypothetical protein
MDHLRARIRSSVVISAVWALGFITLFASWALKDAAEHGKTKTIALTFTIAWFLLPVLAVFPYLFATRGLRHGLIASLKFLFF